MIRTMAAILSYFKIAQNAAIGRLFASFIFSNTATAELPIHDCRMNGTRDGRVHGMLPSASSRG
jgi:hypothetical protein